MRGIFFILLSIILFSSCSTIEDNSPALQGVRDSVLLRTSVQRAVVNDNGSVVIRGERGLEAINFIVTDQGQTQITLGGQSNTNIASYIDPSGLVFSTAFDQASGDLDYSINGDNTISGEFNFTAFAANLSDTVVLSRGFIFGVPILSQDIIQDIPIPAEEQNDFFTARVNTVIFIPSVINRVASPTSITVAGQTSITSIAIVFPIDSAPGTYALASSGDFFATYTNSLGVSTSSSGQLNIVSNDQTNQVIVGEFSFDTPGGFTITDGAFVINY